MLNSLGRFWKNRYSLREGGVNWNGPFVGILGFSQGAAVAAAIASMLERKQTLFPPIEHPPVHFFVSVSGFRMRFEKYNQFYPISTPSLHVIGILALSCDYFADCRILW